MSWNYRLVKFEFEAEGYVEPYIALMEVYYDPDGNPNSFCSPRICGETLEEVQSSIDRVMVAGAKPILIAKDLGWRLN